MKRPWKPPSKRPSPNLDVLLMGEARTLYWNWRVRQADPDRLTWLKAALMHCDKLYGPGRGEQVRQYMSAIKQEFEQG